MHRTFALLIIALIGCSASGADQRPAKPHGKLEVKIEGQPTAGVPILFQITVTNDNDPAFIYWFGGPGEYPPANRFTATFVDKDGKRSTLALSNGQAQEGSGAFQRIEPGRPATLPAVGGPLAAGIWTLESVARSGDRRWPAMLVKPALKIEVTDDPAAAQFGADLLKRVRAGEPFALHVADRFHIAAVIEETVKDLESDDPAVVLRAADALSRQQTKPQGLGAVIKRSMSKQLKARGRAREAGSALAQLASLEGSNDSLEAVIAYIAAVSPSSDAEFKELLLQHLFESKQPRAIEVLRAKMADPEVAFRAAVGLARHHDPAALPVLIARANDKTDRERTEAFSPLSEFWNEPTAMTTLKAIAADPGNSEEVRYEINNALQNADQVRARAGK